MSTELDESFACENRIDQAIFEAENEVKAGVEPILMKATKTQLDSKHYGSV